MFRADDMYTLGSEFNAFLFLFSFHFMRGVPVLRIYRFTFSVQLCIVQTITESYYHKNSVRLCNVFQYNLKYPSLSPICNTLDKIKKHFFVRILPVTICNLFHQSFLSLLDYTIYIFRILPLLQ